MLRFPARVAALSVLLWFASGAELAWSQAPAQAKPAPRPRPPATIEAESIEGVAELEITARGRVEFQREDLSIYSEFLRFNQEFGRVEADGGVRLQRDGDRFFGPRLRYNTQDDTGVFEEPTFIMGRGQQTARGGAERLEFLGKDRVRLTGASFTTCMPGTDGWKLEARELELDYENEEGKARDMRLRLLDTTVFALPYASFPLENRRKSGFLAPYFSHNTRRGLEAGIPYYFNIAPEQDLTLTPIYMSKRGEQLKTNYRYLARDYFGQLRFDYLPRDGVEKRNRSGLTFQHEHRFLGALARIDYNKVSDDRYLVDFNSQVRATSVGNLTQEAMLTYGRNYAGWPTSLTARVQRFQTLQDPLAPIARPYHRVPQLNLSTARYDLGERFDLAVPGEYVRFVHPTLVEGSRTSANPTLAMQLLAPGYFLTPRLGMRTAYYNLERTAQGQRDRQSVNVPWLSLDSGLIFERGLSLAGENLTQTLEPRLFYVYAPYRNQDQIPIFDTALADFSYAQLFSENRFAGGDRFGDANQLTLAATSRLLNANGQEFLRATIGQRYYFKDERVGLTPASALRVRDQSDLLASVGGRVQAWTFDGTVQYNPAQSRAERYGISGRYAPEIGKVINAVYRYNRDPLMPVRQVDISGQWPVQPGWYAIGRYNYSLHDRRILEGIAGIEYNAGCWVFRGVFQRVQAATRTTSTALFVQIEFNGLGQLGSDDTVDFLKRSVPGYARTNPNDPALLPPSLRPRLPFEQIF